MIRTYSDLILLPTIEERFEYLKLSGVVGNETFGFDRYLNQILYKCLEWRKTRRDVIIRDNGCDLGIEDYPISGIIIVHHMNPVTVEDIINNNPIIFDKDMLISTSDRTHKAIHYSNDSLLPKPFVERRPNDTCPWLN